MITAVIFDFFDVVDQSTYQLVVSDMTLSSEQKLQLSDLHKSMDNGFVNDTEFLQQYAQILNMDYAEFVQKYYESEHRFQNSAAILSLIAQLREHHAVGLLSNVGADGYAKFIEPIANNFDVVVTSFQVGLAKPERAIFEYMADQLQVDASECIMIDDSETNCEGARAAGMEAIRYDNYLQLMQKISQFINIEK